MTNTKEWQPPKRPDWVEKLNASASSLDSQHVVSLDADDLIASVVRQTGLSDFGIEDWKEPFELLLNSLEEEAELNFLGRVLTRGDLLRTLEARLAIEEAYKQYPEIDDEELVAPLIITGAARTGTSALYNLLSKDPQNRAPLLWETWFPSPAPEQVSYANDPRIAQAEKIAQLWDQITPEFPLVHKQAAQLPVEDNYLLMLSFRGPNAWLGKTPSYIQWLAMADLTPALDYMKRALKYLQWKYKCKRWILKSPALTVPLPSLFEAFPDAKMVYTHRDPVKLTASSSHLLNTVFWLRSDKHQAHQDFYKIITNDEMIASAKNANIEMMEEGVIPKEQIFHLLYQDFITDNVGAVKSIYDYFDIDTPPESLAAMTQYAKADAKVRKTSPCYKYNDPSPQEISKLRILYGRYQNYFGIPNEV